MMYRHNAKPRSLRWALITIFCLVLAGGVSSASAQDEEATEAPPAIELGAPFADHAILQRGMEVPVWGWSDPGTEVSVAFAGQKKSAVAGEDGKWMIRLDPLKVSAEGRGMTITEKGGSSMTLEDILVGEVWLASGQSNMEWIVARSNASQLVEEIKKEAGEGGQLPPIRQFKVVKYYAHLHPIEHAPGRWNQDYEKFSAIAFAFAHKLYEELGVPIGILNCSFSQTQIEAWTPRAGYENSKSDYNKEIEAKLLETDPATPEHKQAWSAFYQRIMDAVEQNQKVADAEENDFVDLPTGSRPGNLGDNRDATWLFNARLNPVIPYAISGCIWNQGFANKGWGLRYYDNLHALVRGWRVLWGQPELPVYFHQFYSRGVPKKNRPEVGGTSEMRLGTWLARDIPHTGMASQIDIQGAIHYHHKSVPGQRLALHALKNQYVKDVVADGPIYRAYEVKGDQLILSFDHAEGGLVVADVSFNTNARNEGATGFADPVVIENGEDQVTLFYLAGEDRVWHPAKVRIEGDKAVVTSAAVKQPRGVSYASGGMGSQPGLYNKALLPTTPFIVYDHELVLAESWPDRPMKIAGVEVDTSMTGLLGKYRKMPILSTQFRDDAVLQAGQPVTIWGAAQHYWELTEEDKAVIHFSFGDIKKTIPVTEGMKQWRVTLPPMEPTDQGRTLKVSLTLDGELAHERVAENVVFGDVWYVAGLGGQKVSRRDDPVAGPIRIITRSAKTGTHHRELPFSVAISTTPETRYSSRWAEPKADGFAADLGKAIHARTGHPVGIIYMHESNLELKHWMDVPSLAKAPSLRTDYEDLAAITPGTSFYRENAERYIDAWKSYWGDYIPEMIATRAVPDGASWGGFPTFKAAVDTDAIKAYNCMLASFRRTQLKGVVFMTEQSMVEKNNGADFAGEMSALANGWKRLFKGAKDPHFIYTLPAKSLAPKISSAEGIVGASKAFEVSAFPESDKKGNYRGSDHAAMEGLVEAVIEAAY